jgi:probable O-glycosylation ligase (exosortase A-associated)
MRDFVVAAIILGSLPVILWRPWIGVIMWCWVGYMNPHRLSWSFATEMPVALMVALCTLIGILFMKEPRKLPMTTETKLIIAFFLWNCVTTYFAFYPADALRQLDKVWRIQLFTLIPLMLINNERRLKAFVWVVALSIGFYGVKGGYFVLGGGAANRVWGPSGTFIQGNNELGLALIMIIPLLRFMQLHAQQRWLKWGFAGAMVLSAIAAIGTHSRGAFLAIIAMGIMLWIKSRQKVAMGMIGAFALLVIMSTMPPEYYERLATIQTYTQDGSAMGRINAWWTAWYVALERPLVGGGFEVFQVPTYLLYAPDKSNLYVVVAHSIYFSVLGEHGFVGLALFVSIFVAAWRSAGKVRKLSKEVPKMAWLGDLAAMLQVSLLGYAVGGAFLSLAYFDLPYHLVVMVVIARLLIEQRIASRTAEAPSPMPRPRRIAPATGQLGGAQP